jgi:hypothetical protein
MQKDLHQEVAHYLSKNYTYTNTIRFLVRDGFTEDEVRTAIKAYLKENRPLGMDVLSFAYLMIHTMLLVPLVAFYVLPFESDLPKLAIPLMMVVVGYIAYHGKNEKLWAMRLMTAIAIPGTVYLFYLGNTYFNYLESKGQSNGHYTVIAGLVLYALFAFSAFRGVKLFFDKRK